MHYYVAVTNIPGVKQPLEDLGILHSIMRIEMLPKELVDQGIQRIAWQNRIDFLTYLEGIQEAMHYLLEILLKAVLCQYSHEHRSIKRLCIVGHQNWIVKLSQVGKKPDKKISQRDGWHWITITIQPGTMNGEACDICCSFADVSHRDSVAIKDTFATDGCQLDDATRIGSWKQNYEMYQDKLMASNKKQLTLFKSHTI